MMMCSARLGAVDWRPIGVDSLERAALDAVKSAAHTLVVAGPGAGKTELLAQRACYLLQSGLCVYPRNILAISFKRDAARNLEERVERRCGAVLSRRFHSYTFDAFAKGLVDRFGQALPKQWRPRNDYEINFDIEKQFEQHLRSVPAEQGGLTRAEIASLPDTTYKRQFIGRRLSDQPAAPSSPADRAAAAVWQLLLHEGGKSWVNFHMLGRLAEELLTANPQILRALRASYAFVFLDEFQDTTSVHYDLLTTAFKKSDAVLTAVGDAKQSIMRWALALPGIFGRFQSDFSADVLRPICNYRSAPKLVRIIGKLAAAMEDGAPVPVPMDDGSNGEGECRLLRFPDQGREAAYLAGLVDLWRTQERVPPREICILTRQTPERYVPHLQSELSARGIKTRIEERLQALLAEPITTLVLDFLKLSVRPRAPESWQRTMHLLLSLAGGDTAALYRSQEKRLTQFVTSLSALARRGDERAVDNVVQAVVDFIGRPNLATWQVQYLQGAFLDEQIANLVSALKGCLEGRSWSAAIDEFEGADAIPIMTIHKSKGLEYHTVVFLGLEDYPFRNLKKIKDDEDACSFFVALSRAKKRVIFTAADRRSSANHVRPLYDLLASAGVKVERC